MFILTIRTDKPEAELGIYDGQKQIAYEVWTAHRQLAESLHLKIRELLTSHRLELNDIQAIVVFKGPGSFTGLRIGMSVANALAFGLSVPIVGENETQLKDWRTNGVSRILMGQNEEGIVPEYGAPVHITPPRA